jgi:hypothetical protein
LSMRTSPGAICARRSIDDEEDSPRSPEAGGEAEAEAEAESGACASA